MLGGVAIGGPRRRDCRPGGADLLPPGHLRREDAHRGDASLFALQAWSIDSRSHVRESRAGLRGSRSAPRSTDAHPQTLADAGRPLSTQAARSRSYSDTKPVVTHSVEADDRPAGASRHHDQACTERVAALTLKAKLLRATLNGRRSALSSIRRIRTSSRSTTARDLRQFKVCDRTRVYPSLRSSRSCVKWKNPWGTGPPSPWAQCGKAVRPGFPPPPPNGNPSGTRCRA